MSEQFDLIVLGSGSGAQDGANKAAKEHDARVALIENTRWGGSCPNVACIPEHWPRRRCVAPDGRLSRENYPSWSRRRVK